jgi:amino acid transporter
MSSVSGGAEGHHEGMIPVESVDVSKRDDVHKLHAGAVGLMGVLFLTVTGAAPISAMLFNTPLALGFGNGQYAPGGFIFATIILTIFSVSYIEMSRRVTAAGGFYSFISHGLGRALGMGAGLAAALAYCVFEASLCGGFAYFVVLKLNQYGVDISWYWPALGMVLLISILTYFHVELSARLLGIALICEVVALLAFDVIVFAKSGNAAWSSLNVAKSFNDLPAGSFQGKEIAAGSAAIGLFFAFWSWVGFEMAPNYGEESRNPKRIVPIAMYVSVIGLGIFYSITSWAAISGYDSINEAVYVSQTDSGSLFFNPAVQFGSEFLRDVLSYLIITGSFACGMAFHNTAARYFYSLGRELALPGALGRTHERWKSPHIASVTQSVFAAVIVIAFALFATVGEGGAPLTVAYLQVYGLMAFMGVVIILAIQALVVIAIFNYFRKAGELHWFKTVLCPIVGAIAQAWVLYLAIKNIDFIGSGYYYARYLAVADLAVFLFGVGYAYWLRSRDRARYEQIGRLINEGIAP